MTSIGQANLASFVVALVLRGERRISLNPHHSNDVLLPKSRTRSSLLFSTTLARLRPFPSTLFHLFLYLASSVSWQYSSSFHCLESLFQHLLYSFLVTLFSFNFPTLSLSCWSVSYMVTQSSCSSPPHGVWRSATQSESTEGVLHLVENNTLASQSTSFVFSGTTHQRCFRLFSMRNSQRICGTFIFVGVQS